MTPERWQEVTELLHQVLQLEGEERDDFLTGLSHRDAELHGEILSLLSFHQAAATDFLCGARAESTLIDQTVATEFPDSMVGRRFGAYELGEPIGVGGMGEVYRAFRADDQYRKQVALKVVPGGQDSRVVLGRFRNERQILASLEHPNIARLLDGGTTTEGTPYFVMELVDGAPIDRYCEENNLATEDRVRLFLQVCSAVQYAHQRLIVHRDLKPSNILVTEGGIPKLLDFGIAKILDTAATEVACEPTLTIFRALTPGYASPEQIKGEPVTTASDVYSLGVVLYELLTGCSPYHVTTRTAQELARAACEVEPEKPSTALRRTEVADRASSHPRPGGFNINQGSTGKIRRGLRGDLDNIVLMALRKEPQRRYASVDQFVGDLRRYLDDLPVSASKDTLGYRSSKFIRRHKAGVAATIFVGLALSVGLAAILYEARLAQRRFNDVRSLANSLIFDVHDAIQDLPGSTPARRVVVVNALKYLDDISQDSRGDPGLQRELAAAYRRIGEVQGGLYGANLGDPAGALRSYQAALAIRQALLASRQRNFDDLVEFAKLSRLIANVSPAVGEQRIGSALQTCRQAALMLEQALPLRSEDTQLLRELMLNYDRQASLLGGGGFATSNLGDVASALPLRRRQLELAEQLYKLNPSDVDTRRDLVGALGTMGDQLANSNQQVEALQYYSQAQRMLAGLAAESPTPKILIALYDNYYRMAPIKLGQGDVRGSANDAQNAVEVANKLYRADPQNTVPRLLLAAGQCYLAQARAWEGDRNAATAVILDAIRIDADLVKNNPHSSEFPRMQFWRFRCAGSVFKKLGDYPQALHYYREAATGLSQLEAKDPSDVSVRQHLADSYNGVGSALVRLHNPGQAEEAYTNALRFVEADATSNSPNEQSQYSTANAYSGLAEAEEILAANRPHRGREQIGHWQNSRAYYQNSQKFWNLVKSSQLRSPTGNDCMPPTVVALHLAKVNVALTAVRKLDAQAIASARD